MKKRFFVFLALLGMGVVGVAMQGCKSRTTGECTWTLTGESGNYMLMISGSGAMGDYGVEDAPWDSFCDGITTVVIGNSVTTIGDEAFRGCTGLTSIIIPPSVVTIGTGAFAYCSGLKSVTIPPSVTTIGNAAFASCRGLTSVVIGNAVATIGNTAFAGCDDLTSVVIGLSVATIGEMAFAGCSDLTSVTIPPSVAMIGGGAFYGCMDLTRLEVDEANRTYASVDDVLFTKDKTTLVCCPGGKMGSYAIPSSVVAISEGAFVFCTDLTSITIPPSVVAIGEGAFAYCIGLTSVTNLSTTPQVITYDTDDDVFEDVDLSEVALRVPAGSVEAYRAAPVWRDFGRIEAIRE
jgi:hypothetical protein